MIPRDLRGAVAIVGADETDTIGVTPDRSALTLHAEAARNALDDAGLEMRDVDGIFSAGASPVQLSEYLGIVPRHIDGTMVGGGSFIMHAGHATSFLERRHGWWPRACLVGLS